MFFTAVIALAAVFTALAVGSAVYLLASPPQRTVLNLSNYSGPKERRNWFEYWAASWRAAGLTVKNDKVPGLIAAGVPVGATIVSYAMVGGPAFGLIVGAATLLFPWALIKRQSAQRAQALEKALPRFIKELSTAMRKDALEPAIRQAYLYTQAPLNQEISRLIQGLDQGIGMTQALRDLAERNQDSEALVMMCAALEFYHESGAQNANAILASLSSSIEDTREFAAKQRALTRMLRLVRTTLVVVITASTLVGIALEPSVWGTPAGIAVLLFQAGAVAGLAFMATRALRRATEVS